LKLTNKIVTAGVFFASISLPINLEQNRSLAFGKESESARSPQRDRSYFFFILGSLASAQNDSQTALNYYKKSAQFDPDSSVVQLHEAEELLNLGEGSEAKNILNAILISEKKNPDFYILRARVSSQEGDMAASVKALDEATALFTKAGNYGKARETLLTKVALLADNKKYTESVNALEKYIHAQPEDEIAYYFLGKIHSIFQNRDAAKRAFNKALHIRPGFIAAAKALGLQYELEAQLPEAIAVYQRALRSGGADEELLQKLVNLSLIMEDYKSALEYLGLYLAMRPDDSQSQMRSALIQYKLKNYSAAREILEQMLDNDNIAHDRVLFYLGTLTEEQNDFAKSISYYEQIKPSSEYFIESRLQVSFVLANKLNRTNEALRSLDDAIGLKSDSPELYLALAAQHEQLNQISEAIRVLTRASEHFKSNEKILFMLGSLLDHAGDYEEGIKKMREVLAINPNNAHALNHIGYTYAEHKINLDEAEGMLKKALQISPDNGFIIDSLGWVYYQMGKFQKARELLERANKLSPGQPVILEHLADSYIRLKMPQLALAIYKRVLKTSAETQSDLSESEAENQIVRDRVREKMALLDRDQTN